MVIKKLGKPTHYTSNERVDQSPMFFTPESVFVIGRTPFTPIQLISWPLYSPHYASRNQSFASLSFYVSTFSSFEVWSATQSINLLSAFNTPRHLHSTSMRNLKRVRVSYFRARSSRTCVLETREISLTIYRAYIIVYRNQTLAISRWMEKIGKGDMDAQIILLHHSTTSTNSSFRYIMEGLTGTVNIKVNSDSIFEREQSNFPTSQFLAWRTWNTSLGS